MARRHWLRKRCAAQRGTSNNRRRPRFEPLEERRLLAITVNTLVDEIDGSIVDGDVSLRDAIAAAPSGETINFDPSLSGQTITLNLGELHIDRSMTIDGSSLPVRLTIDASGNDLTPATNNGDGTRVLRIDDGAATDAKIEINGLALTGGDVKGSGGAIQTFESLSLVDVTIEGNSARGAQGHGGGVWAQSAGTLTITGSTIRGNAAQFDGGGVWASPQSGGAVSLSTTTVSGNMAGARGGGLYLDSAGSATVVIRDSTISGNTTAGDGGGVYARTTSGGTTNFIQNTISGNSANWRGGGVFSFADGATSATIRFSTITANTADADANNPTIETGGGVFATGVNGQLTLSNSIVAGNNNPGNFAPDVRVASGLLAANYNLIGVNSGSGLATAPITLPDANGNLIGGPGAAAINPGLSALAANGGPTETHALLVTSPAIGRGNPALVAGVNGTPHFDQRGEPFGRTVLGPGATARIDIGSIESHDPPLPTTLQVDSTIDEADGDVSAGRFSLREAIAAANQLGTTTIVFSPQLSGRVINLTLGELVITRATTIDGGSLGTPLTIDAQAKSRVFRIASENGAGASTINALTIAGGKTSLTEATYGGGVRVESGGLKITNSTIRNNLGGGIATAVDLTVLDSTLQFGSGRAITQFGEGGANLIVTDSTISGFETGGVRLTKSSLTLTRSTITDNPVSGISATDSNVDVIQSTIADQRYGAITLVRSNVTVTNSVLNDNRNPNGGGAIYGSDSLSTITVTGSTLSGNIGGAIRARGALTVVNCTVSGNRGTGIVALGDVQILHSTITGNKGTVGGVSVSPLNLNLIQHSIVSGNTSLSSEANREDDLFGPARLRYTLLGRDNLTGTSAPPVDEGGSIIGTNLNPIDAKLWPLADNGGPTPTHLPMPGSPAINAGDPALVAGQGGTPSFDQRGEGFARIVLGRIDMGAVEASVITNTPPTITSPDKISVAENVTTVSTVTVADPDLPPQTLTFSITGGNDAAKFTLSASGVLSFKTAQDYEIPGDANGDRIYHVDIRVDDGFSGVANQAISVTVTPANDHNPIFLSPSAISVVEGSILIMPVTATDGDLPPQQVAFAIAGGNDADHFVISPSGSLSFVDPPSHAAPTDANGDNVYLVTVQADDGAGGLRLQDISVTVTSATPPADHGDFDGDGTVDAADLAIWRQNFGTTGGPNPTPGDADHDRDVDGADFLIWQRTLGPVAASPAASTATSHAEPTSVSPSADGIEQSFQLAADVLLANPLADATRGVDAQPRRRPAFRPTTALLPSPDTLPGRLEALSSPDATDAALATHGSVALADDNAVETKLADRASLDALFAAVAQF